MPSEGPGLNPKTTALPSFKRVSKAQSKPC